MLRTRPTMLISHRTSGIDPRNTDLWEPISTAVRDVLDDVLDDALTTLPRTEVDRLAEQITGAAIDRAVLAGAVDVARPDPWPPTGRRMTDAEVDAETAALLTDDADDLDTDEPEDETR